MASRLEGRRVLIGVGGGIAAYKVCDLVRRFVKAGADVTVVPTPAALEFVGSTTWAALTSKPIRTSQFDSDGVQLVEHVHLGKQVDLVVIAPATADLVARLANGRADDLLTATMLMVTEKTPVVVCPAMHTEMWRHPATQANVATLAGRGLEIMPPADGRLTGADSGPGRLPEPEEIFNRACSRLESEAGPLAGRRVVVTAGGTREYLDPVRYIGNSSSGKQGFAIAAAAQQLGAEVHLIAANPKLPTPAGVRLTSVVTTEDLKQAVDAAADDADIVVMAAAPADFKPANRSEHKIKKVAGVAPQPVELVENPDILAGLVSARGDQPRPLLVGFAAETGDGVRNVLELAHEKLVRKGCDVLVVNDVTGGAVFGSDSNAVTILRPASEPISLSARSKTQIARELMTLLADMLTSS